MTQSSIVWHSFNTQTIIKAGFPGSIKRMSRFEPRLWGYVSTRVRYINGQLCQHCHNLHESTSLGDLLTRVSLLYLHVPAPHDSGFHSHKLSIAARVDPQFPQILLTENIHPRLHTKHPRNEHKPSNFWVENSTTTSSDRAEPHWGKKKSHDRK